jgi:oligosaccharide 4-alpha-D-glucosyltransferase
MVNTSAYNPAEMEMHFWFDPSVSTSVYQLYDDDGHTRGAFGKGQAELTSFAFSWKEEKMIFNLSNSGGEYIGRPSERKIKLVIHNLPEGYTANGLKKENGLSVIEIGLKKNQSETITLQPQ